MSRLCLSFVLVCICVIQTGSANGAVLTGGVVVASNSSGGDPGFGGGIWSTSTQNWWKLWVSDGPPGGAFVNGPNDASAGIAIPMTVGTHTFTIQGAGAYIGVDFFALNLFFDGQTSATQISAFAPLQQDGNVQPFFVNNSGQTSGMDLDSLPAAGSLVYTDGGTTITLTDFRWARPEVFGQDRIAPIATTADGAIEFLGQISLTVETAAVPEPHGLTLIGTGIIGLVAYGYRRKRQSA